MPTHGHLPLLHLKNLALLSSSWRIGQQVRVSLLKSCKFSWIYSIKGIWVGSNGVAEVLHGSTQAWSLLPVHESNLPLPPSTSAGNLLLNHAGPIVHGGKESVDVTPQPRELVVKAKRKYVRKKQVCKGINGKLDSLKSVCTKLTSTGIPKALATASLPKQSTQNHQKCKLAVKPVEFDASGTADLPTPKSNQRGRVEGWGWSWGWGQGRGRRGNSHKDTTNEDSAPNVPPNAREFKPPSLRVGPYLVGRVQVLLSDLAWGGEVLHIPCPVAVGTIVEREGLYNNGEVVHVDFGS